MNKLGRRSTIDAKLEKRILRLIHSIEISQNKITWELLTSELKKSLNLTVTRQTLASNKKIMQAYKSAKSYQNNLIQQNQNSKYKNLPREALRQKLIEMQARIETLEIELASVRAQQYDQLSAFTTSSVSADSISRLLKTD